MSERLRYAPLAEGLLGGVQGRALPGETTSVAVLARFARVPCEQHQVQRIGGGWFEVVVQVEVACALVQRVDQQRPYPDDLGRFYGAGDRVTQQVATQAAALLFTVNS